MSASASDNYQYRALWDTFRQAAQVHIEQFHKNHANPREAQLNKLRRILAAAESTEFGRKYQFSEISDYDSFKQQLPISGWDDVAEWIDKATVSEQAILSAEPPLFYEPTSGSSSNRKLIPYTPSLLLEFQSAIIVWLASLYDAAPEIADGRGYWAMSPQLQKTEQTPNGTPIGCGNDMGYLMGSIVLPLLESVLNPVNINSSQDTWRIDSLIAMINAEDLSMISVWSPTFLLALLEPMIFVSSNLQPMKSQELNEIRRHINTDRQALFDQACQEQNFNLLWPNLKVLSSWTAGPSLAFSKKIAALFPKTKIVPKGLLATEGVVSISYGLDEHCPVALDSHFLEFKHENGDVVLADEVQQGEHYQPLLTTGGGLYRYNLGDVVEIEHNVKKGLLCLRFVERADTRCDLVGEKLDESLARIACKSIIENGNAVALVPVYFNHSDDKPPIDNRAGYALLIDEPNLTTAVEKCKLVEQELLSIYHYQQAHVLGQIAPLKLVRVDNVSLILQSAWESLGLLAGDYKPSVLVSAPPLANAIHKHYSMI